MLEKLLNNLSENVMRSDYYRLRQQLLLAKRYPQKLEKALNKLEKAQSYFESRLQTKPNVQLAKDLPVAQHSDRIVEAIQRHQVVVIAGETGSGKTTQIPKMALMAGLGEKGMIACTQPRRIAARSMAERVSEELNVTMGQQVGYQVRFDDSYSEQGWIKFMTDGILLAETQNDKFLNAYDCIIIDEAHERSLNIDFLLGYLKQLLKKRKDLKVIVTSATIDTEKFSKHFNNAPVINVEGRSYPVEVVYRPLDEDTSDLNHGIYDALMEIYKGSHEGDVLVFLSGEKEILEAAEFLQKKGIRNTEILPLYARLTAAQQMQVFHPGDQRRVILSTNVAETSLTVPRIHYVIDSGVARVSRYSSRSKIQGLLVEPISQASANQRSGRCGRIAEGVCYRLYAEEDFEQRDEHTDAEILRTSLASVILRASALGFGHIETFPFVDAPDSSLIADGYQLLTELHAIDKDKNLTATGKKLYQYPIDVQLGQILVQAEIFGCLTEALIVVSALTIQDVRERPLDKATAADTAHQQFYDKQSDFLSFIKLWDVLHKKRKQNSNSQFRKWCRTHFISYRRFMEWKDIHQQLKSLIKAQKSHFNSKAASYESLHQSILAGFISHVGHRKIADKEKGKAYQGARNRSFHIFPGSGLFNKNYDWIVAASIVQTTKVYGRIIAKIEPQWIEQLGKHVIKTSTFDPYWSKKQGSVMGYKRLSLFGLPIVSKRAFHYGPTDIETSHKIFIENGLVEQQLKTRLPFYQHNIKLVAEIQAHEDRQRKQDLLIEPWRLAEMYSSRIPNEIYSEKQLSKWMKGQDKNCLKFNWDQLTKSTGDVPSEELFPQQLQVRQLKLDLEYNFSPGEEDDGITVTVPLQWLNSLNKDDFEWQVPGLAKEKMEALIRSLPKPIRRNLVPAGEFAQAILDSMDRSQGQYFDQIRAQVQRMTGSETKSEMWSTESLPEHLRFRIQVVDENGQVKKVSRDFESLLSSFSKKANQSFQKTASRNYKINGARDWVFQELDSHITLENGLVAYPAIVDQGEAVGLRLFETQKQADEKHLEGLKKLVQLKIPGKFRYIKKNLQISIKAQFAWNELEADEDLKSQIIDAVLESIIETEEKVRDLQAFDALLKTLEKNWFAKANEIAQSLSPVLELWKEVWSQLLESYSDLSESSYEDMEMQLNYLIYDGFLYEVNVNHIQHYLRFLKGVQLRLEAAIHSPAKESEKLQEFQQVSLPFYQTCESSEEYSKDLQEFHILLEEYRISLFAQSLGTQQKVSSKRIRNAWKNRI